LAPSREQQESYVRTLHLLVPLLVFPGCGGDDVTPPEEIDPNAVVEGPVVEPEPPKVDPLEQALAKADQGLFAEALQELEPLLVEHAEDPALWYVLETCALATGEPGLLLDRLSVTDAVGGMAASHHSLRATLALAADRHADAVDAANALRSTDEDAAAAFLARTILAGAPYEEDQLDAENPHDALVLAALTTDTRRRLPQLETAAAVGGWRAALLRAELLLEQGETEAALAALAPVTASEDIRAILADARFRLPLEQDPAAASELALATASKALAAHDSLAAAGLLDHAVGLQLAAGLADDAYTAAKELREGLVENGGPALVALTPSFIDAAIIAGHTEDAIAAGSTPLAVEDAGAALPGVAVKLARAAWRICDLDALQAAQAALEGSQASVVEGLQAHCRGELTAAREQLDVQDVPPDLALDANLALALAWYDEPGAPVVAQRAVEAATTLGWPTALIEANLALERHARLAGNPAQASKAAAALQPHATPALQAELYARALARGDKGASLPPAADDEPALLSGWRAFSSPAAAPAEGEAPAETTGVAAWAAARHALASGDAAGASAALSRAMVALPMQRQGRWSPPLALDGADGPSVDRDVIAATPLMGKNGEDVILALHEFSHYRAMKRLGASTGYDWTLGIEDDAAATFREAFATEQARSLLWLAGTAGFPAEARAATAAALPEAACLGGMDAPVSANEVRGAFSDTALFSIRLGERRGELLLVTPSAAKLVPLDNAQALRDAAADYMQALQVGFAFTGKSTDPRAGDRFRRMVIDKVIGDLVGIARYLVVADPDLLILPWAVLPEQAEGRRYLADIRTVAAMPYVGAITKPMPAPEGGFKPDFLGMSRERLRTIEDMTEEELAMTDEVTRTMLEAGLKLQSEIGAIARLFGGGYSVTKEAEESTREVFESNLSTARYLHLAGVEGTPGGGFQWADGQTSLPSLACDSTVARMVVLSTGPSPEEQLLRAQVLRDAGAGGVLVAMWNPPQVIRSRYLSSVYDSLNRGRAPARALAEARESLVTTLSTSGGQSDPSYWGAFLYIGAP